MANNNQDSEAKQRLITHVNKFHQDCLARFLEHHNRLSNVKPDSAFLEDITLSYMIISVPDSRSRYYIPFDPPLQDWTETRQRLKDMDAKAQAALGRSSITVKEYIPPGALHGIVMMLCIMTYLTFYSQSNLRPGALLYDRILFRTPGFFVEFLRRIQPVLFPVMLLIHISEVIWLDRSRLRKYNVPRFTGLWCVWAVSNFLEGYGAFQRFDGLVRRYELMNGQRG